MVPAAMTKSAAGSPYVSLAKVASVELRRAADMQLAPKLEPKVHARLALNSLFPQARRSNDRPRLSFPSVLPVPAMR